MIGKQLSKSALILSEVEGCKRANQPDPSTSLRMSLFALLVVLLVWIPASAQELHPLTPHPEGVAWPTSGWTYGEMPSDAKELVKPLVDKAMSGERTEVMGETRSIVIVHRGQIVFETFRDGFDANTKQMSWSVAKSVTNSLVGRAVRLGVIDSIDDPMPGPYPEGDPRLEISWRHWLNMTEGLSNHELSPVPLHENLFVNMMFGAGKTDVAQFAADNIVAETTPGEVWKYSTAGYHMIGWALGWTAGASCDAETWEKDCQLLPTELQDVIQSNLNERLGMSIKPEFDAAGTYLGGSNVWASAHDYAKFGYLYLRDGVWEGERYLPEGWVDFSRTKTTGTNANTYGAGFWITSYGAEPTRDQAVRSPPWDAFNANGSEGQTIWIVPSRDLVIVRTGQMANNTENWNAVFEWCQEIARAFPEVDLTPASFAVETVAAE